MTPFDKSIHSSLGGMQGQAPYDHEEIAALRQRAWSEQGLLIISPSDKRLEANDRDELIRIAEYLYGKGGNS